MANNLSFTVTCVDKATAAVNRINDSVNKMTRPWRNLSKSVGQFGQASGFTKLGKTIGKATSEAGKLAKTIATIAAPMAALIGGGSLAGLYALATGWAHLGAETSRTAQILGITAQELDTLRNAGTLAGVSAETMTSGFQSFADTLQDARWGRNQPAFAMLQYLGIGLKQTKDGAIDTQSAMIEFADKIKQIQQRDPGAARKLAGAFGVESLLPILAKGGAAMKAYQEEAQKLSGAKTPEMIARANAFELSLKRTGLAVEGMKTAIGDKLIPVLLPLIDKWTVWVAANRELIGQKVAEFAKRIGDAIEQIDFAKVLDGVKSFAHWCVQLARDIDDGVKSIGGWKIALGVLGGLIAVSLVSPLVLAVTQLGLMALKIGMLTGPLGLFAAAFSFAGIEIYRLIKAMDDLGDAEARRKGIGGVAASMTPETKARLADSGTNAGIAAFDGDFKSKGTISAPQAVQFFESKGWTRAQAMGIAANIQSESAFNPDALGDKGNARGLGQWHPDRQATFAKQYGHSMEKSTALEQLGFYDWELRNTEKRAGERLGEAATPREAAAAVSMHFERPADSRRQARLRGDLAEQLAAAPVPSMFARQDSGVRVPSAIDGADGSNDRNENRRLAEGPAPQFNVTVQTKVDSQGGVRTRVETPTGVKIGYTSPVMAGI